MHILRAITDRVTQPSLTSHAASGSTSGTGGSSGGASSPSSSSVDQLTKESTFLNLLVAQIKNQDPLSPADPTQFTSQLAQFSELEQVIAIRGDIEKSQSTVSAAPTASATPPASTASSPATTQS